MDNKLIKTAADQGIARLGEIFGTAFADTVIKKFAAAGLTSTMSNMEKEAAEEELTSVLSQLNSLSGQELVSALKSLSPDMQKKVLEASPELRKKVAQAMAGK